MNEQEFIDQFNRDWYAAGHPKFREIAKMPEAGPQRGDACLELHRKGVKIDDDILLYNMSPWMTHRVRTNFGVPYIEPMFIDFIGMNGIQYVQVPFPAAPLGMVPTVEINMQDYAGTLARLHALYPLPPTPPPAPPTGAKLVGTWTYGNIWGCGPGANAQSIVDGEKYPQDGKVFLAHENEQTLMGWSCYFTEVK